MYTGLWTDFWTEFWAGLNVLSFNDDDNNNNNNNNSRGASFYGLHYCSMNWTKNWGEIVVAKHDTKIQSVTTYQVKRPNTRCKNSL